MSELVDGVTATEPLQSVLVTEPPASETKQIDLNNDLTTGFVVGLTKEGGFLFQVLGNNPGLCELIGLQEHAKERIRVLYGTKQMTAEALTLKMLDELSKAVSLLNEKVDSLEKSKATTVV